MLGYPLDARGDRFGRDLIGKCVERERTELALLPRSDRERAPLYFFVADDCDVRVAHEPRVADLSAKLVGPQVAHYAKTSGAQNRRNFEGVVEVLLAHRDQRDLFGGQPHGEGPRHVLDVNAQKALERAEDGAVEHDRPVRLAVVADELELEAIGEGVI